MIINAKRATANDLLPHLVKIAGIGRGHLRYELMCKYCRDGGTVSAGRHTFGSPKAELKAAEAFAEQGWWIADLPICPNCYL